MTARASGGRVALVTGAGRGMGLAITERLLTDGLAVMGIDINFPHPEALESLAAGHPGRLAWQGASVTEAETMRRAVAAAVERWDGLDVLVNNAGLDRRGGLSGLTEVDWERVMGVNLKGPWLCSLAAAPAMRARGGGSIVNIGSISAAGGDGVSPAYAASKAGLIGLTRYMAHQLGPEQIRVNLIAPGLTLTEWVQRNLSPERLETSRSAIPLRRAGEPADVAAAVSYFTSEDARHVTGQVLSVSGGAWMP